MLSISHISHWLLSKYFLTSTKSVGEIQSFAIPLRTNLFESEWWEEGRPGRALLVRNSLSKNKTILADFMRIYSLKLQKKQVTLQTARRGERRESIQFGLFIWLFLIYQTPSLGLLPI